MVQSGMTPFRNFDSLIHELRMLPFISPYPLHVLTSPETDLIV
jgi:hypothetical protein